MDSLRPVTVFTLQGVEETDEPGGSGDDPPHTGRNKRS